MVVGMRRWERYGIVPKVQIQDYRLAIASVFDDLLASTLVFVLVGWLRATGTFGQ
jgi:hypothetical protein